ncbi:MAG: DUF1127 domain-containing protein [Rhodospirillales bacterium]|jgi:uncharacterized protein YjiS (DUF1127 family)|nr:DUF1127 domain-containing protein [Rhodospirillales bacterium]MDP6804058.1 DUF1127 domain-containing protein [Rhodospirillales bacterium]
MWISEYVAFYAADRADAHDNAWIIAQERAIAREARRERARRIAARLREVISVAVGEGIVGAAVRWFRRRRYRAELEALSEQMLADIGITRADIPEVVRAAYRRPAHRHAEAANEREASAAEEPPPAKAA